MIPTAIVRDGDRVLAHGSTGSRWMRRLAAGAPTCLAVTALDGVVVARSAFESSLHYRSAVLFGACTAPSATTRARARPHHRTARSRDGRPRSAARASAELAATLVLALPITEWSLKVSAGWPEDPDDDVAGDAWAGVVPMTRGYATPQPAPDLRAGIAVPASVRGFSG